MLGNVWVNKKKERIENKSASTQSRTKILHKPNMVAEGENHHESERYMLKPIFRERKKTVTYFKTEVKMVIRGKAVTRKNFNIQRITFYQSPFVRLTYSSKQPEVSGFRQQRFASQPGVGCRSATAAVLYIFSLQPGEGVGLSASRVRQRCNRGTTRWYLKLLLRNHGQVFFIYLSSKSQAMPYINDVGKYNQLSGKCCESHHKGQNV